MMKFNLRIFFVLMFSIFLLKLSYSAEYYISKKGKGRRATKNKPAKDLGNASFV